MDEKTYKIIFARSPTPTLYVVSRKVELANPAAKKLLKRLDVPVAESVAFGKLWPKGTTATGKGGLTGLKALKSGEYEVTLPDGAVLTVEVTALPGKSPIRAVVTLKDVTESVNKENVLRESEERYRSLLDTMNDGFGIQDEDGVITYVNDRLCDMLGYPRKELIGRPATELMDDVNKEILIEQTAKREKERGRYYEIVFTSKDGKEIHTMVYPAVIRDASGNYIGSSAVITDITKRKQTEEALRESEEKLRAQYKGIPIPTYTWQRVGDDFILVGYNDAAEAITQGNVADFVGTTAEEMYRDTPEIIEELLRCFAKKTPIEREMVYRFKVTGESKHLAVKYAFVPPDLVLVHTEDITDRKRGEEELRRHHDHLEELVEERTAQLKEVNVGLEAEITEREQAEEELSKSEREKSTILENMSEYVVYTDKEMGVIWANKAVADWLESAPDDLAGRKCYEMWFGRDRVCDECHALTVFETGKRVKRERKLSDGSIWDITCDPVRDDSGEIIGAVEVSSDVTERKQIEEELRKHRDHLEELVYERTTELEAEITERKRSEEALKESEENYRMLHANIPVGVFRTAADRKGRLLSGNPALAEMFGFETPDEIIGINVSEFYYDPKDRGELLKTVSSAGTVSDYEVRLKRADGKLFWVSINARAVKRPDGEIAYVDGTLEDITERKSVEEALKESEVQYRSTIDSMNDAVHVVDSDLRFVLFNSIFKEWNERLGLGVDVIGKNIFEVFPFLAGKVRDEYYRVFRTGEPLATEEDTEISGDVFITETRKIPIFENGDVVRVVTVVRDITDRKLTESALRESEEKYRNLIERSNDAVAIIQEGVVKFANERVTDVFGYTIEELIGKDFIDYIHPDEVAKLTDIYERRMSGKAVPSIYETVLKNREGESLHVEINAGIIQYEGKPADFAFVRDIAERKTAEEALRASEEKYRTLIDNAGAPVTYLNLDGTILLVNTVGAGNLGGTPDDFVGKSIYELLPDMADKVRERVRQVVESEAGNDFEDLVELPSGGRWFYSNHQPVVDARGKVFAVQIVSQDITERKRAEEALRESEGRYRTLHTNIPVGVFRTSAEPGGHFISANPALAGMFGYETMEEMYDLKVSDLYLNPKDRANFIDTISSAGAITDYVVELKRADGTSFWGSLSARAVEGVDGEVAYFDGILEDVTERKKAELALADSEKKYRALYETTRALSVYADVDEVLRSIGEQASILFEAHDCTIYTINRDEGVLAPRYSDSKDFRDEVMSFNVPIGLGIIGHVAETGEGVIVNYDDKDVGLTIPGTERSDEDAESVVAVPLKIKDKVAGVIILSRMGEKFYAGDLEALYAFSGQAAVAVERAGLLEEVRTSEEKYRTTFESTGTAIVLNEEDTTISFANKGFEILSGYPREEVENKKSWTEFVAPYELERMREYHDERRRPSGEAPSEYEYDFMRPDGSVRRVFVSIAMVPGTKQSVASLIDITEIKRAEERYRTTVESTGTAIALVNKDGVVTFVNKELERLGGIPREDLENKVRWTDFILPEDVTELQRYESELLQGREIPPQIEFRFVRPHGGIRYCLLNAALLPGTTTLVVSVLDITDRKHAEETVERERRAFAVVAEAAAQGKDIRDMCERVLTGLNDALGFDVGSVRLYNEEEKRLDKTAVVGITEDEETLVPPQQLDDKHFIGALIARTRKEIFAPDVAAHEVSKTHTKRIDELDIKGLAGYPLIGAGGHLIGTMELIAHKVMGLGEDENEIIRTVVEMLTVAIERRLADEAVAESEEKYRALFEQAGDAVFLETLDGKILEVNEQACDMLGYTRDELLEMGVADLTPPEIHEVLPDVANELFEKGVVQMETANVRKDGSFVPVEVNARLISVGGRRLVFALVRDISVHKDMVQGLKKQAYELLDLKRAKDTLTDLVVHDIKNISSSMLVWLELLQDGVFGPMSNEQDETIARVIDNNMQLFDLSQELLDVARSEEGEIQMRKHPFLLDKSVTELAEYYLPTAEKQSKNLYLDIKDEPILVYADEERVRRVVSNLVTNALKFVEPNEGEVRVSVDKDEKNNSAVVRVADNGRGIPEEFQKMIFEKFRQVELRDAGFKRGAGLGLTFCKMVVSEHDGDMWVESDGERGSTFVFTLPLYQR